MLIGGITAAVVGPHPALTFAATAFLLAVTAGVILAGLVRLVVERGVVLQAVFGALAVYMLVGLTFAFLIGALATRRVHPVLRPGDRRHPERARLLQLHRADDDGVRRLHGRHARGRALAVLEMLVGQLYLVTVIATLVGNLRHQRR